VQAHTTPTEDQLRQTHNAAADPAVTSVKIEQTDLAVGSRSFIFSDGSADDAVGACRRTP
jgi:hypothetical protein